MGDVVEGFRLSPQQRSLWRHLERAGPGGAASFRAELAALVRGPVELESVRAALERAVARHEVLRTGFQSLPGVHMPVQVIADPYGVVLERIDGTGALPEGGPALVDEHFLRRAATPLDPAGTAALEAAWIDFGPAAGVLLLGLGAGRLDARGLELLLAEVVADCAGQLPDPPPDEAPLQYADLAEWQNELLEGDAGHEGVSAWRRAQLPARPPVDLPVAVAPRGPFCPERVDAPLDPAAAAALESASERTGVPREHLALAAWLVLLWRRSGQEERLIGIGADGRGYEELAGAVGLFERELPLAVSLAADESGLALARRVSRGVAQLLERQETFAWERAVDGVHDEPWLPIGFGVDDHRHVHRAGELSARVLRRVARTQPSVLRAVLVSSPSGAGFELHFDGAQIARADVERIGRELAVLVGQLAADPERPVAELDPLADADGALRAEALAGASGPALDFDRDATIHALIGLRAAAAPDAPAVLVGAAGEELTHGQLELRAGALAARLRELGVGPDQRVGLCCERGAGVAVGILGIQRAGAGYVPIDPAYPAERIRFLLEDAACSVVVVQPGLEARLPSDAGARVLSLSASHAPPGPESASVSKAALGSRADNLAYVIYTSGSTGTPKGVEVEHRSLVHSTLARTAFYGGDPSRFLVVSSYAFDSSVTGIFWALASGGALVLPEEGRERDARDLAELIAVRRVTHTLMLPSLWNLLLDHGGLERLASLETVIVAGEACTRELAEKHARLLPGCRLVNEYGPTEGTVWSTAFDCAALPPQGPVPIGRPIARAAVYLLDERGRPVPLGAPGELWIAGAGIARGYLGRPELTAERFRPDPFAAGGGGRAYRTGDLARWNGAGALEFLGRVDHQVKLRGYRIELGEIEEALVAQAEVGEACCLAREDTPGDQRLVAYVTPAGEREPEPTLLAEALRARLPEYMVPTAYVVLGELPRTPNGKLDRAALPAPGSGRGSLSSEYVEPGTPLERAFCEVWAEVLDAPEVGLGDDFFELGGHSILAVRLVARLGETLGVDVSLRALFGSPSVSGLLAALAADPACARALEATAELLAQVEQLSDDEVEARLDAGPERAS